MAYMLDDEETAGMAVFIVGFALDEISFSSKKLKFIAGISFAIYVAAFDLDDDGEGVASEAVSAELDSKAFLPRPLSQPLMFSSSPGGAGGVAIGGISGSVGSLEIGMGVWSTKVSELNLAQLNRSESGNLLASSSASSGSLGDVGLPLEGGASTEDISSRVRTGSTDSNSAMVKTLTESELAVLRENSSAHLSHIMGRKSLSDVNLARLSEPSPHGTPIPTALSMPPTWDPVDTFSYPVAELPISWVVPDNLLMEHFTDIQHLTDGSNANIFIARFNGEKVIIKMIKEEVQLDAVAVHEFDVEHGLLSRISHPNIIKLMGAGRVPRRFIVLEWLSGGSLSNILSQNQVKPGLAQKLFRRPSFTYANLLSRAKDIADAIDYLNQRCHPGATIIHRDLKPDNVGFTAGGMLKLFDFGLCTCVRQRSTSDEAYEMTGNTGSLRYMAPEVALRRPYNEKADVYSFGIMVWQMARDRVPFKGMSREDFMQLVVHGGERPKLDKSWPAAFSNMLVACWHRDHRERPTFASLSETLGQLMEDAGRPSWGVISSGPKGRNSLIGAAGGGAGGGSAVKKSERQSTWF